MPGASACSKCATSAASNSTKPSAVEIGRRRQRRSTRIQYTTNPVHEESSTRRIHQSTFWWTRDVRGILGRPFSSIHTCRGVNKKNKCLCIDMHTFSSIHTCTGVKCTRGIQYIKNPVHEESTKVPFGGRGMYGKSLVAGFRQFIHTLL